MEDPKKKILILGAGMQPRSIVDYFKRETSYQITVCDLDVEKAKQLASEYQIDYEQLDVLSPEGKTKLSALLAAHDFCMCMLYPTFQTEVMKACIQAKTPMIHADYLLPEMEALGPQAKEKGVTIFCEMGLDPGLDHVGYMMLREDIDKAGDQILEVRSYGSGIPAPKDNNNLFGYKFSWAPKGAFIYYCWEAIMVVKGQPKVYPHSFSDVLGIVEVPNLGVFEAFPTMGDASPQVAQWNLPKDISLIRGTLRYSGYTTDLRHMFNLGLLENSTKYDFTKFANFGELLAKSLGCEKQEVKAEAAKKLGVGVNSDIILKLEWLGIFGGWKMGIAGGTMLDAFVEVCAEKLKFEKGESDRVMIYIEIDCLGKDGKKKKRTITMVKDGDPEGFIAMNTTVGKPLAITVKNILEGKITAKGVLTTPDIPGIHNMMLEDLKKHGIVYTKGIYDL